MNFEFSKAYNPKEVEEKIYKLWEKSGFFNPDKLPKRHKKSYCIALPPPNVTGELHMGHALNATCQDILIRWKRMKGFKTLWLPGVDHAGIATQNVVEKELKKEGKTRFDLGREKFIERIWQWKEKYGNIILDQFKKLGVSCDWSRIRFTMDADYSLAVKEAFSHYYKKGWIYQGERVVNWCPRCQTSLSDLEIEYQEEKGKLWYIRYPLKEKKNGKEFIVVATTRPETMLGDAALAVNPNDERYKKLVGEKVILPLTGRKIPIISDRLIDPKFGTGAVKVTPAHDIKDYEIGLGHELEIIKIIDEHSRITKRAPITYQGLSTKEARLKIIEDLRAQNLLEKEEDYIVPIPRCYRCKTVLECLPSKQWFLKMDQLAKVAIDAVKSGKVNFRPKKWQKVYFDWLKNIRDWCISRQIWWGHKIPLEGVDDVLDTWFSSALWPFATLGWPVSAKAMAGKPKKNRNSDLERFYPTDVLATARDLINLWVARMVFSGMEFMHEAPFHDVYIHPTVLTREGKRMSKSLGTGINPMRLIEQYGADSTRFGIIWQVMEGQEIKFVEDNIIMGKKFCNKIWNATRFVLQQFLEHSKESHKFNISLTEIKTQKLAVADKKILKKLSETIKTIDKNLESLHFGQASHKLYDFFWHDFCDKYIEEFKKLKQPHGESQATAKTESQKVLIYVLLTSLKILHPFIPFLTEEIYQELPIKKKTKFLIIGEWPD
jgi:valyl-tRNA synthetase